MRHSSWWFAAALAVAVPETARGQSADGTDDVDADFAAAIGADAVDEAHSTPTPAPAAVAQSFQRKMNPDISLILDVGFGWYNANEHIHQSGHALDDNGFGIQGLEFAASASVDPYFRFDMNFELSHLHLEEVYLTTLALPASLQARLGYFNAEFGRNNSRHLHNWHFVNPPLSHTRFMAEEHFSGPGAELSVLLPLPWYVVILGQGFGTNRTLGLRSTSFATVDLTSTGETDGLEDFVYVGRLVSFFELSDDWSLNLGLNGAWGQSPYVPDNFVNLYGADFYLKWRPISSGEGAMALGLTGEYVLRDTQVPGDFVRDHGGYVQLDLQWNRYWITNLRAGTVTRISGAPPAGSALAGRQMRGSLALGYMPTHFSKVRLQLDVGRARKNDPYVAGFVQLEVSAGEHGAHKF